MVRPFLRAGTLFAWAAAAALGWTFASPASAAGDSLTITITPKDDWPPAPITDLVGAPGAEGQLLLQWTAPDSNNDLFAARTPAAGYTVRLATFSADSVGSTTTWWNAAMDVAGEPAPAQPGMLDTLLLNGLEPGATYFAAIRSSDSVANLSPLDVKSTTAGQQSRTLVFDAVPPAPGAPSAVLSGTTTITLSWSAVAAADLHFYRIYVDSAPPFNFAASSPLAVSSSVTSLVFAGLTPGTSYFFAVTAVDKGAPDYLGYALESSSSPVSAMTGMGLFRPKAPIGLRIAASTAAIQLDWMPVRAYESGQWFTSFASCTASELNGYRVYRATTPIMAPWTELTAVSSATLTYTDLAAGPQYYYHVKAENLDGLSQASLIRAHAGPAYVVGPDGRSVLEIPAGPIDPLMGTGTDPDSAYGFDMSTAALSGSKSVKSMAITASKAGQLAPRLELASMGTLRLHYDPAGTVVNSLGTAAGAAAVVPSPQNMSVFWNNGAKWVQLFGKVDAAAQVMVVQTKFIGEYELRSIERTAEFTFDKAGLTNRFLTPNGDGKNDDVVFIYSNPKASEVTAKIYDVSGKLVQGTLPAGPVSDSVLWDGKAGGKAVPGGVYIYRIEAEGKAFSGTVIVIK